MLTLSYPEALLMIGGYVFGSIPVGPSVAKAMNRGDLRKQGSGNIGTTNVLRVLGKKAAVLTFAGDFLKGAVPVAMARHLSFREGVLLVVGFATILGHLYPVFLQWRGGKGVATSLGVFSIVAPSVAGIGVVLWMIGAYGGGVSSVGALMAFGGLPIVAFFIADCPILIFSCIVSLFVILRHKENIRRLIQGKEKKV